jgi:pimeloyl-ACP methyl ester carboxylesterase
MRVASSDHVHVVVHEFGGTGRALLLSHATGFHGYCYLPIADALDDRFTSYALDYRGHGDTPRPADWQVDWERYGDDALAAARAIAPDGGLTGFGHSMGGAALLMAAHREPDLFDTIVLFEPIVFPPDGTGPAPSGGSASEEGPGGPSMLVVGARRRRPTFESFDAALANFGSKPPMMNFDPDVLRLYVAHGFRTSPEGVRLKCDPEHEARTFEQGGVHGTWELLPEITDRVIVVTGVVDGTGPASIAQGIAERLPNSTFVSRPEFDHFGPFVEPARFAELIVDSSG